MRPWRFWGYRDGCGLPRALSGGELGRERGYLLGNVHRRSQGVRRGHAARVCPAHHVSRRGVVRPNGGRGGLYGGSCLLGRNLCMWWHLRRLGCESRRLWQMRFPAGRIGGEGCSFAREVLSSVGCFWRGFG